MYMFSYFVVFPRTDIAPPIEIIRKETDEQHILIS